MRLFTLQIVLFLTDSNNSFLFIQCSYFHICLSHFFLRFVFSPFLSYFSLHETNTIQLPCSIRIHYNQHSNFQKYSIQKFLTRNGKQRFKAKKETKRKNCNLLKNMYCLYEVSAAPLPSLNFLSRSKFFIIMGNPGIFRLLAHCILISLIVKKRHILYSNFSFFWMLISIFSSILFTGTSSMSLVFLLIFFHPNIDFLNMVSFSCDMWLRKVNSGKVY